MADLIYFYCTFAFYIEFVVPVFCVVFTPRCQRTNFLSNLYVRLETSAYCRRVETVVLELKKCQYNCKAWEQVALNVELL